MMSRMIRDEVAGIAPYNAGITLEQLTSRYAPERIAKLGSNENPIGPSKHVLQGLAFGADDIRLYPDPSGVLIREALAKKLGYAPDRIILGNGSEDLLSIICRAVVRAGDIVVTPFPSFPLHEDYAAIMGAEVRRIPVREDFSIDLDGLIAEAPTARLLILSNPMNPVGSWLSGPDLERLAAATGKDCLLVVDEAYFEYAQGPGYADALEVLRHAGCPWVVLRTFSKAWGLAALRIGYGIVSTPDLKEGLDRVRTPFNVNGPAQRAALLALDDPAHVGMIVQLATTQRDRLEAFFRGGALRVAKSKGNFLFLDVEQDASLLAERLLTRGVIVKAWKQEGFTDFLRVSVGSQSENDHFMAAFSELRGC